MEQKAIVKFHIKLKQKCIRTISVDAASDNCLNRINCGINVFWNVGRLVSLGQDTKSEIEKVYDFIANDRIASLKLKEEALRISRETFRKLKRFF